MKGWIIIAVAVFSIVFLLCQVPGEVGARPAVVDDDWAGAEYSTIQEGIDGSSDGEELWVWEGWYTENVIFNKTITLVGNHSSNTTIDAQGSGHTVVIDADHVNMTGFTITGSGTGAGDAGINFGVGDNFHMDNCTVDTAGGRNVYQNGDDLSVYDNCTFLNSSVGVHFAYGSSITLEHCTFEGHAEAGLFWYSSHYGAVRNSTFVDCGVRVWGQAEFHYEHHTVLDCTTNGDPIRYYVDTADLVVPDDTGQVFVVSCDGAVVDGLDLASSSTGITVAYSDNVLVANSTVDDMYSSLQTTVCDNVTVRNVTVTGEPEYGLYMDSVTSSLVEDCNLTMPNGTMGIFTNNGCSHLTVNDTFITAMNLGIQVYGSNITVQDCTIVDCNNGIYIRFQDSNLVSGCDIEGASNAITLADSGWHTIVNTSIHGGTNGIQGQTADNCTIAYNEIFGNSWYGIRFWSSSGDNIVHHNNLADNGGTSSQATDESGNNTWDDGVDEGNYWDDWGGNGTYEIDGAADAEDRYPLGDPVDTDAPEKISEFGLLFTVIAAFAMLVVVRRRL